MGAYNWIEFTAPCPRCGTAQTIRAQTHMASDYDGDDSARFHEATYRLGQCMRWWSATDPKYRDWRDGNRKDEESVPANEALECCYASCGDCKAELFAVIRFVDRVPTETLAIGTEESWPSEYSP